MKYIGKNTTGGSVFKANPPSPKGGIFAIGWGDYFKQNGRYEKPDQWDYGTKELTEYKNGFDAAKKQDTTG